MALVGAPLSKAAYLFRWNGSDWFEEQKLLPSGAYSNDFYGYSLSLDGDVALVGAFFDDEWGFGSGAAYLYRWNGSSWQEEKRLSLSNGEGDDYFGKALSLSGDVALIGAEGDDENGNEGAFGRSVSLSGDVALIGAPYQDNFSGAAYLFRWNGNSWQQEQKILPTDEASVDFFGTLLSVNGDLTTNLRITRIFNKSPKIRVCIGIRGQKFVSVSVFVARNSCLYRYSWSYSDNWVNKSARGRSS